MFFLPLLPLFCFPSCFRVSLQHTFTFQLRQNRITVNSQLIPEHRHISVFDVGIRQRYINYLDLRKMLLYIIRHPLAVTAAQDMFLQCHDRMVRSCQMVDHVGIHRFHKPPVDQRTRLPGTL